MSPRRHPLGKDAMQNPDLQSDSADGTLPVVVVGAGLAGLSAALHLSRAGVPVRVFEASDDVGGRVRTDEVETEDGVYRIDRGFQVYLDAYPEGRRLIGLEQLGLRSFYPGAFVYRRGKLRRLADPLRRPFGAIATLASGLIGLRDAYRMALLDLDLRSGSAASLWERPEQQTIELLREARLSERFIDSIARSFYGGVFFDRELKTSARQFAFTYRMFAEGHACLPDGGIDRLPKALAAALPEGVIACGTPVSTVDASGVTLRSGERVEARAVVVATDQTTASTLLPELGSGNPRWQGTTMLAFAADEPPVDEPILVLDGEGTGPINHLVVPSEVAQGYAPRGKALIYANAVGSHADLDEDTLIEGATEQLAGWFGDQVRRWRRLAVVRVPHALPNADAGALHKPLKPAKLGSGVMVCGDYRANGSDNGAMESGRRAAEAVLAEGGGDGAA